MHSRFQLVETQVIEFNQVAIQKIDMRTDDMFNRVMSRDNIAVVAALEFAASGARLVVANSHIYWDHRYRDVKLVQIGMLMEELEKVVERFAHLPAKLQSDLEYNNGRGPPVYDRGEKGRDIPLILCVDLNSLAGSAVHDFLSTGQIPPDHEDFMSHVYGPYTAKGLHHRLGLRSACASFGEMRMTNFTPTFDAAIDYIFYSHRPLKVTSVLGDVDRGYLEKTAGFPNAHFPSEWVDPIRPSRSNVDELVVISQSSPSSESKANPRTLTTSSLDPSIKSQSSIQPNKSTHHHSYSIPYTSHRITPLPLSALRHQRLKVYLSVLRVCVFVCVCWSISRKKIGLFSL